MTAFVEHKTGRVAERTRVTSEEVVAVIARERDPGGLQCVAGAESGHPGPENCHRFVRHSPFLPPLGEHCTESIVRCKSVAQRHPWAVADLRECTRGVGDPHGLERPVGERPIGWALGRAHQLAQGVHKVGCPGLDPASEIDRLAIHRRLPPRSSGTRSTTSWTCTQS